MSFIDHIHLVYPVSSGNTTIPSLGKGQLRETISAPPTFLWSSWSEAELNNVHNRESFAGVETATKKRGRACQVIYTPHQPLVPLSIINLHHHLDWLTSRHSDNECMCTLHVYNACVHCMCTMHVYIACVQCMCTLHVYNACVHCSGLCVCVGVGVCGWGGPVPPASLVLHPWFALHDTAYPT